MCLCFAPQWGRLVHGVLAVRTGVSALLPEVRPPASPLPPERRRSALPARPSAHRPAHQWRGEDGAPCLWPWLFTRTELQGRFHGFRFWLKFVPGIFLLSPNATRKPVKAWQWVRTKRMQSFKRAPFQSSYRHTPPLYLPADENKHVTRLCELHGSSSVSACGLSLGPSSLRPLLRALKLQSSLTELHLSGNRLDDELVPDLVATTVTMPRLQVLDVSACRITAEGLEKAVGALKGQSQSAFPVKSSAENHFPSIIEP